MTDPLELPPGTWERLASAPRRLLCLDHDGTLAPLVEDRRAARALPRSLALLGRIAESRVTRVAVVSGRPCAELARLVPAARFTLVGEHGWEARAPGSPVHAWTIPQAARDALAAARARADAAGLAGLVESKRASLVLHVRGLPEPEAERAVAAMGCAWSDLPGAAPLALRRIDGGLELRAAGRDKGMALLDLLSSEPPGTLAVHVGDDETDEDAFRAVAGRGLGVLVAPSPRPTSASCRLSSCEEVTLLLSAWLDRVEGQPAVGRA